jgi:hypothetical protein
VTLTPEARRVFFGPGRVRVTGSRPRGIVVAPPPPPSTGGQGHGAQGGQGQSHGGGQGKGRGGGNSLAALAQALGAVSATGGKVVPSPDVGTTWYLAAGVPSNTLGAIGSWYTNSSNRDVYSKTSVQAVPTWQSDVATDATTSNVCNATAPSGIQAGDLLILLVDAAVNSGSPVIATHTGWSVLTAQQDLGSGLNVGVAFWKIADGTETVIALGSDTPCFWHVTISRITNALASAPINVSNFAIPAGGAGVVTSQSPAVSPTVANSLIVALTAMQAAAGMTLTAPGGMTLRYESPRGTQTGLYHGWADVTQAGTGTTGTKTWSMSSASLLKQFNTTFAIAPLPASAGSWARVGAFSA